MKRLTLLVVAVAVTLMAGPGFAQPTDNSWEVMDGLLLCPAGAGAGDTVTGYIVFGGVIQTRADFEAVDHTVAWFYINGDGGPSIYDALDVAMAEDGGISVDLPGDFSPDTTLACGTGIEDGWAAGVEMAAAAETADVATALADGYFGDVGGASCAGGAPGGGGCGAALTDTGEDTEGYDICLTGTIAAGEEVTVVMFSPDGEVDPDWWELGTRTDQGWVGDYTFIGDSPTFELTQAMLDGSLEFINGEPEVFVHYNGDDLCVCEGWEPPPEGVYVAGSHRLEEGDDLALSAVPTEIVPIGYQWTKDGEDLEGETGDTLTILDVTLDDSGVYRVVATTANGGDAPLAEFESDDFLVMVFPLGEMPLAGGLGLGLLAGACALAGAVSIRRKK